MTPRIRMVRLPSSWAEWSQASASRQASHRRPARLQDWARQFGTELDDDLAGIAVGAGGNVYVAGRISDFEAHATDAWVKRIGPAG